ncbi:MAG: polysaccharide biosynthesis tyrosine autokinase [Flavobacteriales bacterium]|nr:polysaccharide biosynthesis tyrosine autokinase [Flavobacteriales bacterium]
MSQQQEKREIPMFNQDFDLGLFLFITRKNLKWALLIFLIVGMCMFLYLRYTIPLYRSVSIIQLTDDIQQKKFLSKEDYFDNSLAQELELMRSPVFLQRTLDSMDLDITYFNKGRIIDFDNYNNGPYRVYTRVTNASIYGVPINIRFKSLTNYQLKYRVGNKQYEYDFITNKNESTEHFEITTSVRYEDQLLKEQVDYYFKINDPTQFVNKYGKGIEISILNEAARTIRITTTDVNYNRAADMANAIAREFEHFNLEKKKESSNRIIEYIDRTLGLVKDKLEEADSSLADYKKRHRVVESTDFNPLANKNLDIIKNFESRKLEYEVQLMLLNDIISKVQAKDINIYQLITLISQANIQGNVSNIVNNLNNLLIRRDQLRQSVTENSREYQELTAQIETQKKLLVESVSYVKQTVIDQVNDLNQRIKLLESELFSGNSGQNMEADYMQLKRIYEVNQKYYDELISKRAEYILAREGYTPGYRVLQVAKPNTIPVSPRRNFIIAIAFVVSLLLSLTVIVLHYVTHDLILSVNDIIKYTHTPVLGVISKYKDIIPVSQLVVDKYPKSLTSETFRTIRSNLDFISNQPGSKLISVTSTISGEGKTFVAINLAGILAFAGKRVIIVDADMRKPKIHLGFNASNEKGLSTLLIGKDKVEDCIRESSMKNLFYITAGPIPPNPSELLLGASMSNLIKDLLSQYDYVLIDNPPVGIVADAHSNLKIADYPIYVFRADYSRKFFINNLNKIREEHKLDKMAVILNGFDLRKTGKYSGYGYGYGYSGYGYGMGYGYLDKGFGYYEEDIVSKPKKGFWKYFFNKKN